MTRAKKNAAVALLTLITAVGGLVLAGSSAKAAQICSNTKCNSWYSCNYQLNGDCHLTELSCTPGSCS